jgi:alpha-tubulin suppressor-like RCC1 family protein
LGQEKTSPTLSPLPIENLAGVRHPGGIPQDAVRHVALSAGHSMLVMATGEVFMSGSNARGQLGFGAPRNPYDTQTFERPVGVDGVQIVSGACGQQHSAVLAFDGAVYSCGQNEDGRLGHDGTDDRFQLTRVASGSIAGRRVTAVSCGTEFTLCISDDGQLHGTGSNGVGQLGLGDEVQRVSSFTPIPLPGGKRALQVSAGDRHALVLCEDHSVVAFGDNTYAAVNAGQKGGFVKVPMELSFFSGQSVAAVLAGKSHSLVVIG